jgi:DNA-directed RNA polymerase specialized sigma24 family protein
MEGMTITEMAEILGIAPNTVMQRLYVAKIKPITKEALYDKSALEAIRNVPGKGRPPRKPEPPAKPAKK